MAKNWKKLRGSLPALITPFRPGGLHLHLEAFAALVDRQARRGSRGIVVAGTTGEAQSLAPEEYRRLLETAAQTLRHRVPVIAGVTASCTQQAIEIARIAERAEADILLCGAPPYLRPTQEGLFRHVQAIHDATHLSILVYDVPARSGIGFSDETLARLAELPRVIGVKDATGDLRRPYRLRRLAGDDFLQFSGDDSSATEHRLAGGHGCISVTANVAPALCAALHEQFDAENLAAVMRLHERLRPLNEALFMETNPIPVKRALALLGFCTNELRLPLLPLSPAADMILAPVMEIAWAAEEALARGPLRHSGIF